MAPPFFDTNNYWAFHGATLLASGGGEIASVADVMNSYIEAPWSGGVGQLCAAMAIQGEPTTPPEHFGPREPGAFIIGGYKAEGHFFATVGKRGLQASHSFYGSNETVNLIEVYPDVPLEAEKPPYPNTMTTVLAGLNWPGGGAWGSQPVWVGEYWVEIYEYIRENDPSTIATPGWGGEGGEDSNDPVSCPPRPPWPYREPIATVDGGGPARIRRSRP